MSFHLPCNRLWYSNAPGYLLTTAGTDTLDPIMLSTERTLRYVVLAVVLTALVYFYRSSPEYDRPKLDFGKHHVSLPPDIGIDRLIKSSFDWGSLPRRWPVSNYTQLPRGRPRLHPRVQAVERETGTAYDDKLELWRQEVKSTFLKAWKSYKKHAWMRDELAPLSGTAKDTFGGWAATLIDNLDTLWIMDLKDEFVEAVEAVATLDWAKTKATGCDVFETTSRHLGGLLAAYDLSGQQVLLIKAIELGDMLYAAFDTPNNLPPLWLDFKKSKKGELVGDINQPSASVGSLSLEFTRLSQLTGDPKYYDAVTRVTKLLARAQNTTKIPGMWPAVLNTQNGNFRDGNEFTLAASSDSLYEYLPKMHAMVGSTDPIYEKLANQSLAAIRDHILFRAMLPGRDRILFPGNAHVLDSGAVVKEAHVQHGGCFAGGMFGLAGRIFGRRDFEDIGVQLTWGCIHAYNSFPMNISPEAFSMIPCPGSSLDICDWDEKLWQAKGNKLLPGGFKDVFEATYMLRPEAIESVFIYYRLTGIRGYSDMAYKMFLAIQSVTETRYGNAAIEDVRVVSAPTMRDSMQVNSFPFPLFHATCTVHYGN